MKSQRRTMKQCALLIFIFYSAMAESKVHEKVSKTGQNVKNDVGPPKSVLPIGDKICLNKRVGKLYRALQEWYDDSCNKYQCEIRNGRYSVAVVRCVRPVEPPNAIECHEHFSENKDSRYPFCCKRLRCIVTIDEQKYIHVSGQPGEFIPNELYADCADDMAKMDEANGTAYLLKPEPYPGQSAREGPDDSEFYDEPIFEDEADRRMVLAQKKKKTQEIQAYPPDPKTLLDWALWPVQAIIMSELEVLRIVDYIDETMYRYWASIPTDYTKI